jgi:branched-chain amino acid aminotransferase
VAQETTMSELRVYIDGKLLPRTEAKVSVWDSGFQCGDGVYEGLRVYRGGVFQLREHVDRLFRCAHAIGIAIRQSREAVAQAILGTVKANGLVEDAHIRITVTRGDKPRTGMDPRIGGGAPPTMVIVAEPKAPAFPKSGIRLVTSSVRRTPAQCLDPKLHTLNQLGQIMAKIEANAAGADEALMLDMQGFVAETNSANIFMLRGERLATPKRDAIMPGFTRALVIETAPALGWMISEENLSLADLYGADEIFITGTVNQVVPVTEVDGRRIGGGQPGPAATGLLRRYLEIAEAQTVTAI